MPIRRNSSARDISGCSDIPQLIKALRIGSLKLKGAKKHCLLLKLIGWLEAPQILWPINFLPVARRARHWLASCGCLEPDLALLLSILRSPPSREMNRYIKRIMGRGSKAVFKTREKLAMRRKVLESNPQLQEAWKLIKKLFPKETLLAKTGLWSCDLETKIASSDSDFYLIFDAFCDNWNLKGMKGNRPIPEKMELLLSSSTMKIIIPRSHCFDHRRDVDWRTISRLGKGFGAGRMGEKLCENRIAMQKETILARTFLSQARKLGLKGSEKEIWLAHKMGWPPNKEPRSIYRILSRFTPMSSWSIGGVRSSG
jgi:hypothetical protein